MPNFTAGTSFSANDTVTNTKLNDLIANATINPECALSINSGTIGTLSCTRGTIGTFNSTTSTFLGAITGSTNVINIGSGQIYKDASGNVGVGTASPSDILHVSKANGVSIFESTGISSVGIRLRTNSSDRWQIGCPNASADLAIYTGAAATERLRIDSSGNVGIGTNNPSVASGLGLVLNGGASQTRLAFKNTTTGDTSTDGVQFALVAASSSFIFQNRESDGNFTFETAGTERIRIASDGRILFAKNTTDVSTAGYRFDPNGESFFSHAGSTSAEATFYVYSTGAAAYRFYVGLGGTVNATNTAISAISDVRLKENIRDIDAGLNKILELKPRTFDWKDGKGANTKNAHGFIAQEIEQVFPDLVDEWRDPAPEGEEPYKSVRQDLIPVLVKAIQELKLENDSLKSRIEALEAA